MNTLIQFHLNDGGSVTSGVYKTYDRDQSVVILNVGELEMKGSNVHNG
jgi:hypothetical protein